MFGYVVINEPELKIKDYREYSDAQVWPLWSVMSE